MLQGRSAKQLVMGDALQLLCVLTVSGQSQHQTAFPEGCCAADTGVPSAQSAGQQRLAGPLASPAEGSQDKVFCSEHRPAGLAGRWSFSCSGASISFLKGSSRPCRAYGPAARGAGKRVEVTGALTVQDTAWKS